MRLMNVNIQPTQAANATGCIMRTYPSGVGLTRSAMYSSIIGNGICWNLTSANCIISSVTVR